ncbi:HDOD domain-containing protein [Neptunicella marina]|uniref:HDOD domain-containing protein n=1 Tax=Neptunicella marina TaxID=2125989 RepID=A0A8J6ITJ4_9ALTE|nr:HDOD domain-containing protein [Neptunicella marina]MBC3765333.1 HDOD domain-containing protein [Neptunicella marina]
MEAIEYAKNVTESFALPDACTRIKELLEDDCSTADDIAEVVALDPSLSIKLLKLANSALYNFPSPINTIAKAVNVIGGRSLYNLVITETATTAFRHFENNAINLERFWQQSVYASLVAKELATQANIRDVERYFLLGLLHNFGELAVATQTPQKATLCEDYNEKLKPWQLQQSILGFTYADVTAEIVKLWGLPDELYRPIEHQNDVMWALDDQDTAILNASARIALSIVHPDKYSQTKILNPEIIKSFGLHAEEVVEASQYARMEAYNILVIMNPDLFLIH